MGAVTSATCSSSEQGTNKVAFVFQEFWGKGGSARA
jgi:hypothetical protein